VGELEEFDGFARIGDPGCGDEMMLWIKMRDGTIGDIGFKSFGCPGAIAMSSMLTELAKGRTEDEALSLTDDDVVDALGGIPERKRHCSLLGVRALHAAVADLRTKRGG
jgi:nitrogen fixation NifU-like protein